MAAATSIVGNLALAPSWERFSDTEPTPSVQATYTHVPSTLSTHFASFGEGVLYHSDLLLVRARQVPQLDLFPVNADDVIITSRGEVIRIQSRNINDFLNSWGIWCNATSRSDSAIKLRAAGAYFGSFLYAASCASNVAAAHTGLALAHSWVNSAQLLHEKLLYSKGSLQAIRAQVVRLHDELVHWPGSYNQLLLAGSLDYCRSAITKMMASREDVHEEVARAIKSYYMLSLSICEQYNDSKTALRRVNLQSVQDRFDLLQESCAKYGVYPRLDELDVADIPSE